MRYIVYILQCSDNSYYVGITNDLERRLEEHQSGSNEFGYTTQRLPIKLKFSIEFDSPTEAIAFEKQIKGWRRAKKEALINNKWEDLPELSKSYRDKLDGHPEPVEGSSNLSVRDDEHFDKLNVTTSSNSNE